MSISKSIRSQLAPIHPEGYPFIIGFAVVTLIVFWVWEPGGWIATFATLWCVYFFRDPQRVTPTYAGVVVAPADGRIVSVATAVPPADLGLGPAPMLRISIFMSVFDCHVNRSPVLGRIERIVYHEGLFLNASLDKASEDNERNALIIVTPEGTRVAVVQIAGLIARRIVRFVSDGQALAAGQRIGMIRFGSRADVYLPAGTVALVGEGQTATAGETVLADLAARPHPHSYQIG
ncbi:MAG: phosphatidylserine decarboxylase [Xanthobacteraceae bacterium]|nr:phosphatidylserine decarboxylase [Xanthobacteraceae bacterium]